MPWPLTGVTHYHAQLGPPEKGRAMKGLVGVWLGSMIYGMNLWTSVRFVVWSLVAVRMTIDLRYPQRPIDSYNI